MPHPFCYHLAAMTTKTLATLTTELDTLTNAVSKFQTELDAFYLMWAGARVAAVLAPPLSPPARNICADACSSRAAQVH